VDSVSLLLLFGWELLADLESGAVAEGLLKVMPALAQCCAAGAEPWHQFAGPEHLMPT